VVDLSVMDQWNRTVSDVATTECNEVLVNRGTICICVQMHFVWYTFLLFLTFTLFRMSGGRDIIRSN